jgi:DNA ligase (NAD+)
MNYEELKNLVKHHCTLYYDKSAPEISDADFDKLYDDLEAVEKAQGWVAFDSPTVKVGGVAGKVEHPYKLYSLRKVYDIEEVDDFFDVKTPKIDGANLTLVYKRGRLVLALTRGNGEYGDNVAHLATGISNITKTITTDYPLVVINGECVTDNTVENFRNYVSGALGLKALEEFKSRNIKFIAHDMLGVSMNYTTRMAVLQNMGFTTVLDKDIDKYPTDGVVYRLNDYKKSVQLGYTSKYPKFAVALKPRGVNTVTTTLQNVEWAVGRTGTVNPTGVITPVTIEDAVISRVTLHNIGIIEEHNLGIGDTIEIERAGGVIPKFIRVVEHAAHGIKIDKLHAEKAVNTSVYRDGPRLLVKDKSQTNNVKALEYFIKTLEIKGLGPANIEKMGFSHPSELFEENDWSVLGANGSKIESEIERAKTKPYELVLAALGIPGVGKSVAKLIVTAIPKFAHLREVSHTEIRGIGPSTIASIVEWLEDNKEWVEQLPLQLEQNVQVSCVLKQSKKVCVTGKLDMTRTQITELLEQKGFSVSSSVTKDCYALITAGDDSSSKYVKAVQLGVQIIDYWSRKKEVLSGNF